jgi:peptidoglycan hydrolase FlgJ
MSSLISPTSVTTMPGAEKLPGVSNRPTKEQAMHTAKEFESVFLAQFASVVFDSIKSDGPFGGGSSEDIYKSLLAQEYGKTLSNSGGFGIADSVYKEIIKIQEVE